MSNLPPSASPTRLLAVLAAILFCVVAPVAMGQWAVVSTKSLDSPRPGLEIVQSECKNGESSARLTAIVFKEKAFTLRVVDSPSPGNAILENTLRHAGIEAGVNGGYFHPDFTPIGLVVSDGKTIHPYETAKLLSGIIGADTQGRITILRSSEYRRKPPTLRDAIQCGPMLVEHGSPVSGLNGSRIARRTAAATGKNGAAALVYITSVSLEDAAQILSLPNIFGSWAPRSALNLDGGTSSGLWADGAVSLPEIKRVRNFIGVVPRD